MKLRVLEVGSLFTYVPASRASRINPRETLEVE